MTEFGFGDDLDTCSQLFWAIDSDDSGDIEFLELFMAVEMIQKNSVSEKLMIFFELADKDGNGSIDKEEMFDMLKKSYTSLTSIKYVKRIVD